MTTEERAIAAFKALPPDKQQEALDFIESLQMKLQQPSEEVSVLEAVGDLICAVKGSGDLSTKIDWQHSPAVGMWQDREEMQDSAGWVQNLRQQG